MEEYEEFYSNISFGDNQEELEWKNIEIKKKGLLYYVIDAITKNCNDGSKILDVGGGSGVNLLLYGKAINSHELFSLDIRDPPTKIKGIKYIKLSIDHLNELDIPQFNCIVMTEVIEHLYDPDTVIDNLVKRLLPGGILIVTTPNLSGFLNVFSLLLGFQPVDTEVSTLKAYGRPFTTNGTVVGHIRIFTLKAMKEMLKSHNLNIIKIMSIGRVAPDHGNQKLKIISNLDRFFSKISKRGGTRMIAVIKKGE